MTDSLSRICALFQRARTRVVIVSAFLGEAALDRLLRAVPEEVEVLGVYARWSLEDVASGATDWRAWDVAMRHNVTLYECPRLHVKMYIADDRALVGSANATRRGLGLDKGGNLELLVEIDAHEPMVDGVLTEVVESAAEARPFGADAVATGRVSNAGSALGIWLPAARPEVFERAFRGQVSHSAETKATLDGLRLVESDDFATLRKALANTTSFRAVRLAFEGRLVPMYLDEILELLATRVDPGLPEVPPAQVSLLVRWLGYFGSNTHLGTGPDGVSLALYPGERLTSIKVKGVKE